MTKIRLEQHRQLTLPIEMIEQANWHYGDLLEMTYFNGTITIRLAPKFPANTPQKDIMEYAGIGKGVWGNTAAEIDANLNAD